MRLVRPLLAAVALASVASAQGSVHVTIAIDYGGREPRAVRKEVAVPAGSTVVDATRAVAALEQDWLCCSKDDVWSIGGVGPDPRRDRYWFWKLDGEPGPDLPARFAVSAGDTIEWTYGGTMESTQLEARVVSLLPAATEIALAIGAESALVGLSHVCPRLERDLPRVSSTSVDSERWSMAEIDRAVREASAAKKSLYALDEERIRELRPTVVISQGLCPVCATTPETAGAVLKDHADGCPKLLVLSPHSLVDVARNIREVGEAVGRKHAALVAARAFERSFEALRAAPKLSPRPRVAVIEWFEPLWVSGEWIAEMVEAAGGEPVLVGAKESSRRVEWKDLVAADPDVIVLAACSMDVARARREVGALSDNADWRALRAVRASRVFLMDGEHHFSTPGPRLAEGAELLAAILRDVDRAMPPKAEAWARVSTAR